VKLILQYFFLTIMSTVTIIPQNQFVITRDSKFMLNGKGLKFFGFNAYYLQTNAADSSKRYIVDDVFSFAKNSGFKVIRTWAFNNNSDSVYPGVISSKPHEVLGQGLAGLDYVVAKAKEYDLLLILTLANNFPDYGGIEQYIRWANQYLAQPSSQTFSHNHFFTDDSITSWYKYYVNSILNRINTFNGILYKDDPTIFSFELINEASNSGFSSSHVKNWYEQASAFFRGIDTNHLLTTGEIGFDVDASRYSNLDFFYNGSDFLFNGSKGTSFTVNSALSKIDYTSIHSYPEAWNMNAKAGITWIKDHKEISEEINKPLLLGEFGVKTNRIEVYNDWLQEIKNTKSKSAIVWHYVHKDVTNNDGYGFNEFNSPELVNLFKDFIRDITEDTSALFTEIPNEAELYQNFPNPFNPVTTIRYSLPKDDFISINLYNSLGELVQEIETGYKTRGEHELTLSFNNSRLSSGIFIYTLKTSDKTLSKKLILLK
jgi:mannan endo-1,4-beta-mannosidase